MYVSSAPYSVRGFELPAAYMPKGSGFLTQMERTQAAAFLNSEQNGDRVEGVYHQLSDQSKDVLSKLKDGGQVEKEHGRDCARSCWTWDRSQNQSMPVLIWTTA